VIDGVRKEKERLTAAKLLHGPSFLLFIGSSSLIMCYSQSLFSCFIVSFSWSLQLMLESLGCSSIICIDYLILHVITGIMFQNIFQNEVLASSRVLFS